MYCMKTVPRKNKQNRDALLLNQKQYGQQQWLVPVVCLFGYLFPFCPGKQTIIKRTDPF